MVHNVDQEPELDQEEEDQIDMASTNYISFNSKHFIITANLKTSSNQVKIIMPYKVDMGSEGTIIPLHIYKKLFSRATKKALVATRNTNLQVKTYNRTTILQMDMCKIKIEHNNKQKM